MTPLTKVCAFALTFRHNLPDFICEVRNTSSNTPLMEGLVTYVNGDERYSNVRINGKPASADQIADLTKPHLSTRGEFGSDIVNLFTLPDAVEFKFWKQATLRGIPSVAYQFHLPADKNTFWTIYDGNRSVKPELRGELWIEQKTQRLLRLKIEPVHMPSEFHLVSGNTIIDYSEVRLEDAGTFLLPTSSETNASIRGHDVHLMVQSLAELRNAVTFRNCHKFTAKARIVGDLPADSDPH
jgi:hypothetical protein